MQLHIMHSPRTASERSSDVLCTAVRFACSESWWACSTHLVRYERSLLGTRPWQSWSRKGKDAKGRVRSRPSGCFQLPRWGSLHLPAVQFLLCHQTSLTASALLPKRAASATSLPGSAMTIQEAVSSLIDYQM